MLPAYYVVEPTNICNYQCPICPNRFYSKEEQGFLSWDLFVNIINQIKDYAKVIQIYWMGEPLLHSKIFDMISYCKKHTNAKVMISTNGSLLTQEKSELLCNSGLDELIISLDAANNQEIYSQIRRGGMLRIVNQQVEYLLSINSKVHIILQFIDMYANRSEKEAFISKWNRYNCSISIQCLYSWSNQLSELNSMSDNLSPMIGKKRTPCADLWNKMCIRWNGIVSICCFDWHNSMILGNANDANLSDIWNGSILEKYRHNQTLGIYDKICSKCDAWATSDEYVDLFHLS